MATSSTGSSRCRRLAALCRPRGDLDDTDFNNVHVEIEWAAGENQ
jgi:hypothetical protein